MEVSEKQPIKASIVIPSWFRPEQNGKYGPNETYWFASACLKALIERTPRENYELIIINNGSTLTTKDLPSDLPTMEWYWEQADKLITNDKNLGFAPACNQGFAAAQYEYIICLNNDILVWEGWLDQVVKPFSLDLKPPCGVVMPALVKNYTFEGKRESGLRDARLALKLTKEQVDMQTNAAQYSAGAEFGSLWVTTRKILEELKNQEGHYFDENFKLGMGEDRDLWDRVRLLGYQTYRTHDTRVFHQGNMTIGKVENRKDYTLPNREYLAEKRARRNK